MSKRSHHAPGTNLSGLASRALSANADRLLIQSALTSRGALRRSMLRPFMLLGARFLGWWSRSWVGQALGWGFVAATFLIGFRNQLDPRDIGNDWQQFRDGSLTRKKHKRSR